jgi:hypothetical protein
LASSHPQEIQGRKDRGENGVTNAALPDALSAEVHFLHDHFFGGPPPAAVVERYVAANRLIVPDPGPERSASLSRIVQRRFDAEAIEYCFRLRRLSHPLTTKVEILYYLVEVRSAYYERFVNERSGRWRAVRELAATIVWSAWKFVKGSYLIRRHHLV